MDEIKPQKMEFPENEMHVVRRLGKSLILHWDSIPESVQKHLLQQARAIYDEYQTTQVNQKIVAIIENNKL